MEMFMKICLSKMTPLAEFLCLFCTYWGQKVDFTEPGLSEGGGYCSCRMLCRYVSEGDTVVAGRCVGMCQELQGNMEGYDEDGRLTKKGGDCLIEILAYALIACPYMCHAGQYGFNHAIQDVSQHICQLEGRMDKSNIHQHQVGTLYQLDPIGIKRYGELSPKLPSPSEPRFFVLP